MQSATNKTISVLPDTSTQAAKEVMNNISKAADDLRNLLRQTHLPDLSEFIAELAASASKRSFLVMKHNKYVNVLTKNIALFYIKQDTPSIMCFDKEEYTVSYTLEQIQHRLPEKQFFRLNRQYLINFNAIREIEAYFGRKLLVNTVMPVPDKLIVSREKVSEFLHWLDNR